MNQSDKLLVVPVHVDGLHVAKGRSARSAMADFTQLPYLKTDNSGISYEVNGDHPHISSKINATEFETNFWLRPGVHLHWSLPDGLTVGTVPDDPDRRSQPEFPAVPNRWLVQRCYYDGIVQKQWLVESDFLYKPEYWSDVKLGSAKAELMRHTVAYPVPIEATGQPPFRYMGRQTEFTSKTTLLADGDYLSSYLDSLKEKGIDISDCPDKLTAIGYGEPTFAAFYPNSHSVFGLYDDEFGSTPPPVGSWYEVYGWYEHTEGDDSLIDDPIYQLAQAIPEPVTPDNFLAWFEATQKAIDQLENVYRWRATFELSDSVVQKVKDLLANILGQADSSLSLKQLPAEPIQGRESLFEYLTNPAQGGLDLRQSKLPIEHSLGTDSSHILSLESLFASCGFQVPQKLICYGQVWQDSFVDNLTPTPSQIFVANTGTESVAAFVAGSLAQDRYPRQDSQADQADVPETYTSVQIEEKTRLEQFIEAIHLTPALNKQFVDIGARLSEERHTKTFTAHSGSKLWLVKTAALENDHNQSPTLEDATLIEPTLPANLAFGLNELNALQVQYDRAIANIKAQYQQIYADWYRYMMLAYPSDDEALDYEDIRLSPDVDLMIAYIKQQDIKPLQQAILNTGVIQSYNNNSQSSPPNSPANPENGKASATYWSCNWSVAVSGSPQSLASQLKVAIAKFCTELNTHNQAQPVPNSKNQWSLNYTVGPRYWAPNEPTVLLSNLEPSDRHGEDGRLTEDKSLICPVISGVVFPPENLRAKQTDNESLMAELAKVQAKLRQKIEPLLGSFYRRNNSGQAHPFLLEWEANLASVRPAAYRQNPNLPYQADEIRDHWRLAETDAELTDEEQPVANVAKRTISFTGTSVLLNYAGEVMDQALEAYLLDSLEEYFTLYNIAPADQKQHLKNESGAVQNWLYRVQSKDDLDAIADDLTKMGSVYPSTLYGIRSGTHLADGIKNFVEHYQNTPMTKDIREKFEPLLIAPSTYNLNQVAPPPLRLPPTVQPSEPGNTPATSSSQTVLTYLLGLSAGEVATFVSQLKTKLPGQQGEDSTPSTTYRLLTPQRIAVILRYADALGYISGEREDDVNYSENVLWRPLVMGIPDGGSLASAILSIVNQASPEKLTAAGLSDSVSADILKTREIQPLESLNQLASLRHFDPTQMAQLLYHLEDDRFSSILDWHRTQFNGVDEQGHYWVDPRLTAFNAWQTVVNNPGLLTVNLHGFNDVLLSKQSTWQLPVADPLGFAPYRAFSELTIKPLVGRQTFAPLPTTPFSPIRGGHFDLSRLRLVDTFGQYHDLDTSSVRTTEQMRSSSNLPVCLPPRLVQPTRLNARWLDADSPENAVDLGHQEWNAHPASSPICGWVLPNMLDARLMIYNQDGKALGSLDQTGRWHPKPGSTSIVIAEDIPNPHLRRMVVWLKDKAVADSRLEFIPNFVDTIETAIEYIDPDSSAQSSSLPVLIGRPLALVRGAFSLETQEPYAVQQSLAAFSQQIAAFKDNSQKVTAANTQGFENVRFPVRLGEHHRFQDGLVGYWTEPKPGELGDIFNAPQSDWLANKDETKNISVYRRQDGALNLWLALNDPPQTVSMLMDVQGSLHITSGIVPTKELIIPTDLVLPALRAIEVTFLTAPLLARQGRLQVNLPRLSGWHWSWVARRDQQWSTLTSIPRIDQVEVLKAFAEDGIVLWTALVNSGLLTILPGQPVQALYDAKQLGATLDLLFGSETTTTATTTTTTLHAKRKDVERFFNIQPRAIEPMNYVAKFYPQALQEGWLQLTPAVSQSNALFNQADFQTLFAPDKQKQALGADIWQQLIEQKALNPFVSQTASQNGTPTTASPPTQLSERSPAHSAVVNRAKLRDYLATSGLETSQKNAIAAFFSP